METMPLPDLPAFSSRAATGIRRCSPCAGAAFFVRVSQVITKPGAGAARPGAFLPLQNSYQAGLLCFLPPPTLLRIIYVSACHLAALYDRGCFQAVSP